MPEVYEPQEDSYLLAEEVRKYAHGIVLDIGTGSGIQAITAAKCPNVKKVVAVDVNPDALRFVKSNALKEGIRNIDFIESDLFENVRGRFDTIIFNPPYLPEDIKAKDIALDGGKKGYEVLGKFISEVGDYLTESGIALIVFSSLTNKKKIGEFLEENLLTSEEVAEQGLFMEQLFVYRIWKSKIRKELEKKGVGEIKYFSHGKRGLIFTGRHKNKKIAVKVKRPSSLALNRIENEAYWLKRLNKSGIGPKFLFSGEGYIVYEFVDGDFILDYFEKASKSEILKVIRSIFSQLLTLDNLKVDKEEMHHPLKHIIVMKNQVLIDFERVHISEKPKNVTQFCEFLARSSKVLEKKGIVYSPEAVRKAAMDYKRGKASFLYPFNIKLSKR
ncbi:MAG TPA: HemK2/MTQ2 family protein methyltransferase [Candidatus Nanoarchaeia archaeon]|nr:HemK2/MTQ2 family protein methyltransferase [Candidatus Nanoarchaeia archaeon]